MKDIIKINIRELFKVKKKDCGSTIIKKNGEIMRYSKNLDTSYMNILCLLKNKKNYIKIYYPYLYGNFEKILLRLLILYKLSKTDYYTFEKKINNLSNFKECELYIFKKDDFSNIMISPFLGYIKKYDKQFFEYFYGSDEDDEDTIIRYLSTVSISNYLQDSSIKKSSVFIETFYNYYIKIIEKNLIQKFGLSLRSFENYHQLYQFLDKEGYVNKYYNDYVPKMKKLIPKMISDIKNHKLFNKFVSNNVKKIKKVSQIKINKLITKFVSKDISKKQLYTNFKYYSKFIK